MINGRLCLAIMVVSLSAELKPEAIGCSRRGTANNAAAANELEFLCVLIETGKLRLHSQSKGDKDL